MNTRTDDELLSLAAKAARWIFYPAGELDPVKAGWQDARTGTVYWQGTWNPLVDDGEALRLAVLLNLSCWFQRGKAYVETTIPGYNQAREQATDLDNHAAAARRAIVLTAAAMGAKM